MSGMSYARGPVRHAHLIHEDGVTPVPLRATWTGYVNAEPVDWPDGAVLDVSAVAEADTRARERFKGIVFDGPFTLELHTEEPSS